MKIEHVMGLAVIGGVIFLGLLAVIHESQPTREVATIGASAEKRCVPTSDLMRQVHNGMTYEQVRSIMGCEGQLANEGEFNGVRRRLYVWSTSDDIYNPSTGTMTVGIFNGRVMVVNSHGLR